MIKVHMISKLEGGMQGDSTFMCVWTVSQIYGEDWVAVSLTNEAIRA